MNHRSKFPILSHSKIHFDTLLLAQYNKTLRNFTTTSMQVRFLEFQKTLNYAEGTEKVLS